MATPQNDPALLEVQKLCRDFSYQRFKEADELSELKLNQLIEQYEIIHSLLMKTHSFSGRFQTYDHIKDLSIDKVAQERMKKRQQRLAQHKELEQERLSQSDEIL